jgi:hypothetical protein
VNNASERALRPIAVGRGNWAFLGSEAGGRRAAILYSVATTCRQLGADPFAYLHAALPALSELGYEPSEADLTAWLPDGWLARRSAPAAHAPADSIAPTPLRSPAQTPVPGLSRMT